MRLFQTVCVTGFLLLPGFASPACAQSGTSVVILPAVQVPSDQAEPKEDSAEKSDEKEPAEKSFWETNPPVRIVPRVGNFPILPTGPGYYSFRDWVTGEWREKPPNFPYPPFGSMAFSFFDADFRYLDNPKNEQYDLFDALHRIHLGDDWLFSTGGEFRWRHVNEHNSRLTGKDNSFDLIRTRVYADLWYGNSLRFYVEYLDAHSFNQDLAPLVIDVNRSDLLNAFVDVKLWDDCEYPAYLRIGRQEMLLGSQRLISPLDWANTRRTFQGVRAFRQGEHFDFDLFWVQPVIPHPSHFDSVDNNQNFAGLWTTYRPEKGHFIDLYYLMLDNTNKVKQLGIDRAPYNVHTIGARYCGDRCGWLWDIEGMGQLGRRGSEDIVAGAFTVGGGYNWACCPWNPTFWLYYDFASGDHNVNAKDFNTFNQLFPFGHYYFGWLDQVGRQNIHDLNAHLWLYPTKWVTFWTQYHLFWLASDTDALYNAAGNAIRRDATGKAGNVVGNELDFVLNVHLGPHSDILAGYSHLFPGDFIRHTGPPGSAEMFFVQYSFRW